MESAQKPDFAVEWWPIGRPKPYPKNARKWSAKAVDKVAASIREFGWRQPLVCDAEDVIIIGHLRLAAAQSLSLTEVPVHVACDLSPAKVRALRLADNRLHEEAAWDEDLLREDMLDLRGLDLDMSMTGFDSRELDRLLLTPDERADECPETPKVAVTRLGDLWLMGEHRLLCGDATRADDVSRLMRGEYAGLMNTDPPYGIKYDSAELHPHGVSFGRITGDEREDKDLQRFLEAVFTVALSGLHLNAAWYLWHAHLTQGFFAAAAAAAAAQVILHRQIIWVKPVLVFGRGQYHWKHEPCFMGWVEGNQPPDYGDHTDTTVWEAGRVSQAERDTFQHSTPKPVELFRRPIVKHLQAGEIAYDPFAGSGPQFIAAEELGRRCYGLDIEPMYCDVIVQRWQNFTGREATLEGDGRTFAAISAERLMVTA